MPAWIVSTWVRVELALTWPMALKNPLHFPGPHFPHISDGAGVLQILKGSLFIQRKNLSHISVCTWQTSLRDFNTLWVPNLWTSKSYSSQILKKDYIIWSNTWAVSKLRSATLLLHTAFCSQSVWFFFCVLQTLLSPHIWSLFFLTAWIFLSLAKEIRNGHQLKIRQQMAEAWNFNERKSQRTGMSTSGIPFQSCQKLIHAGGKKKCGCPSQ